MISVHVAECCFCHVAMSHNMGTQKPLVSLLKITIDSGRFGTPINGSTHVLLQV